MAIGCKPIVDRFLIVSFVTGEPIMYPRINELIRILHGHDISTFLVTNAQFPDAIRWVFYSVLVL